MKLLQIYQCLCDQTRLRILALLLKGPLCVCHIQNILHEPQVNVSRHLAYLKKRGLVQATRHQNWMIYHLPTGMPAELESHLKCLQDCIQTEPLFKKDAAGLVKVMRSEETRNLVAEACCQPSPKTRKACC